MENRIKRIYHELYTLPRSKEYLASLFEVSTKTIENTINNYQDDIVYDKKLSGYRFVNLLPKYISYESFFKLFENSIGNNIIKNDFIDLGKKINQSNIANYPMIDTSSLSNLAQKIISCDIAINHNCILQINYTGNSKPNEVKYIRPHTIISTGFTYYLYCSYDEINKKDVGEFRSLGFNGIENITSYEYIKDNKFKIEKMGNAYGLYERDRFVTLKLMPYCANFFKREGLLKKENFDFLAEDQDGSIHINMYYNNPQEIVSLIQQWMPQISIQKNLDLKQEIYSKIQANFEKLIQS